MLDEFAAKHGTDKGTRASGGLCGKGYALAYETLLWDRRIEPMTLLEIGVASGASLLMWADYLPTARIIGLDRRKSFQSNNPRIQTFQGDQSDVVFLDEIANRHGPFDLIVDDGSHRNDHHRITFDQLWPHLSPGGF